ncbi:sigma-54-dependent Fis family transcriptional regulator, partial [bacterium]|nr:sigma-54-dependent Fis family transcriptional regulator [bacterium]
MNILLVDDEKDVRVTLSAFLRKLGHNVVCASNGFDGLNEFHLNDYDLIITDIRMPTMDGIEFLRHVKEIEQSGAEVIIITGHGDMDNAVKSLKYGAYDYFQKPINVKELASTVNRYAERKSLENMYLAAGEDFYGGLPYQTHCLKATTNMRPASLKEIDSEKFKIYSDVMRNVIDLARKYSSSKMISVLIEGETGTGKELVSRYIHSHGAGGPVKPFVAINCGAVPGDLFEAELFGHERGAYTGATTTGQKGKLELADGGTIFLDEIGELSFNLQ